MNPIVYIMAGGGGTRLAPLSQTGEGKLPKQFLSLVGDYTLLQDAIMRIPEGFSISVIPEERYADEVRNQAALIEKLGVEVLSEPFGCNTAAAILYAACYEAIEKGEPDRVLCFIPADHKMVTPVFAQLLNKAVDIALKAESVVTIGITPQRAETQYGYIKAKETGFQESGAFAVERFVEKPDREKAENYLKDGGYFWNAGIFVARARVLMRSAMEYCPEIFNPIQKVFLDNDSQGILTAYRYLKDNKLTKSIDYALMEHLADSMYLVPAPADLHWNDLGNWESLRDYMMIDISQNASFMNSDIQFKEAKNCMVFDYLGQSVKIENCDDILVVLAPDGILIRKKN